MFVVSELWKLHSIAGENQGVVALTPSLTSLPAYLDQFALGMSLALLNAWIQLRGRSHAGSQLFDRAPTLSWIFAALAFWVVTVEVLPSTPYVYLTPAEISGGSGCTAWWRSDCCCPQSSATSGAVWRAAFSRFPCSPGSA